MGDRNVVTKEYVRDNHVFADICNYCIYDGREVIKPEDLSERDVTELGCIEDVKDIDTRNKQIIERLRDVLKLPEIKVCNGTAYAIVGIENQAYVDYAMVVRCMVNDALNYDTQLKKIAARHRMDKNLSGDEYISGLTPADKLLPVVTIIVYWNADEWDGARSLHEMFDVENKDLLRLVSDYRLNLVVPKEIKDFGKFRTDFGTVMEYISCSKDKNALRELKNNRITGGMGLSDEAVDVLNTCVNAKIKKNDKVKGGRTDMCIAMDELIEEEKARVLINIIRNYMIKTSSTLEETCEVLGITMDKYNEARRLLETAK